MQILSPQQEVVLKEERNLLFDLRSALAQFGASPDDQETLRQSIEQLDDFFLIVVVGEFNAGKSAFINALLGASVLKEGVTPTTTQINILRHGLEDRREVINENLHLLSSPVELLAELSIVDTPGTNAIIREHEILTAQFLPRADLVLFTTSADRPFTESERVFLQNIKDWGKKIVVVLNKIDILSGDEDLNQIVNFIDENFRLLLGIKADIFPVSARQALAAKQGQPEFWAPSRFADLEGYIRTTLDEAGRIQLKFLNPLGVGSRLIDRYLGIVNERLALLDEDILALDDIDRQMDVFREDMLRDFEFRMADIEKILYEMENRGNEFFDDVFRIGRVLDLIKKDRIQQEFTQRVLADVPQQIDRKVAELVDWLVESDLREWQAVAEHLAERRIQHKERIVGELGIGSFHYDRERLIEGVGRETQEVVDSYDRLGEARKLADGAQTAVAAVAAVEVGAIGLGAIITVIATTVAADVTGILLASFIAALGLFIIPARRRKARNEMHAKVSEMRVSLVEALHSQLSGEIERSIRAIQEAIGPYTRFVRAETNKLHEAQTSLVNLQQHLGKLKTQIEMLVEVDAGG